MLKYIILVVTFCWFVVAAIYAFFYPEMKSIAYMVTGLVALLTALLNVKRKQEGCATSNSQTQTVSGSSTGIQVGRDLNIKDKD